MPAAFPLSLRTIIRSGKSRSQPAAFSLAEPRRGYAYVQAIGTDTPVFWDITFKFTQPEAALFQLWFTQTIQRGLLEFTLPIKTEFGLQTHTCRFLPDGLLNVQEDGEVWVYSAKIMARRQILPPSSPYEITHVFPLLTSAETGYPAVGSMHPYGFSHGALTHDARVQIGTTFRSFGDDRFVINGEDKWTALPTLEVLRPGRTVVDFLPAGTPLTVGLKNLFDSNSSGQIAMLITPIDGATDLDANRHQVALHARAGFIHGSANIFDDTTLGIRAVVGSGVTVSTSVSAYAGESSIAFDGSANSEVNFDSNNVLDAGANDFTIETMVRRTTMAGEVVPFARLTTSGSASGLAFYMPADGSGFAGAWTSGGTLICGISIPAGTFTAGQFYYIAWRRSGSSWQVAVGTTPGGATTVYSATGAGSVGGVGRPFTLGRDPGSTPKRLIGHMHELRYTPGVARDISTVPVASFPRR